MSNGSCVKNSTPGSCHSIFKNKKGVILNTITPFLWFDNNAEEAVSFYTSLFSNDAGSQKKSDVLYDEASAEAAGRPKNSVMTVPFELGGTKFTALNGGPMFTFSHAVSFFVTCETEEEIDSYWNALSKDSTNTFWQLQEYPWSKKYGWLTDKYGLSWQLNLTESPRKITPFLMFDGPQLGRAQEAIDFYVSVFDDSQVDRVAHYPENEESAGLIINSAFTLLGQQFMAMDSGAPSDINFNEAVSFVINCESQDEVDYYWKKLSAFPESEQCGWLKDKFGVSWQVVPKVLPRLLQGEDRQKSGRVMQAMLKMKKLNIADLENA